MAEGLLWGNIHENSTMALQIGYHPKNDNETDSFPYKIWQKSLGMDSDYTEFTTPSEEIPGEIDTRLYNYPGEFVARPTWEIVVKATFCAIIMLLAIVGNLIVIYIVWRNKRMRTATNFYIVNLALSDIMVTVSCTWVQVVDDVTEGWVLGAFFCKFNSFAQVLSLVSSILTLTLISCDRFFGIVFAMKAHMTERRAKTFIILVWICAIGISSPLLFYREQFSRHWKDHVELWCNDEWPGVETMDPLTHRLIFTFPSRIIYYTFISVVLFFFPIVVMTVAYVLIMWRLWSNRLPGERIESEIKAQHRVKKKVIIMLLMILTLFAVCWLPFQIVLLYNEYRPNKHIPLPDWYPKFRYFANCLTYANSAFNPIIYTGFNENFKRGFKALLRCRSRGTRRQYSVISGMHRGSSYKSNTMTSRLESRVQETNLNGGPSRTNTAPKNANAPYTKV